MSHIRNLEILNRRKIIYRRAPVSDKPTKIFDWGNYYEDGTHQCYELFRSRAKITTYKSLKWHMLVLWHLNPGLDQDQFESIATYIAKKTNGFVTFEVPDQLLKTIIYEVSMCDLEKPPKNKSRKIIFNEFTGLTTEEKLKIVGQIVGRSKKIYEDDVYQCMLDINDLGRKITISGLAKLLGCSARTIHRNMGNELKKEKELLNKQL
jgi:hypothetical protein|tara:strand:+ start:8001 stop:8621 length:621 start_codon:yes stop_codon:yes gene_type:complete